MGVLSWRQPETTFFETCRDLATVMVGGVGGITSRPRATAPHHDMDISLNRMKHVWILNHYAQEPGGAGGTRHFSLARHLPAHGWRATIVAASTDHVTGTQRLSERETTRLETFDGVPFMWLRSSGYTGNGGSRIRNMLDYTRAVLKPENLDKIERPDAIIGSSVHPLAAWAGRRLARRYRVPFIFEVRDLWPQTLIDMGRIGANHPAAIALRWLERSLYVSASRIVVLLPQAHSYIEPLGIARDKIIWIPNGVDLDQFPDSAEKPPSDVFTLMYFGAHGEANGLDNVLKAMRNVSDIHGRDDIVLRLIGDGPLKPSLQNMARSMGLDRVRFEDPVPKSKIPALAREADGFVICVRNIPNLYRFGISMNKIFDYMAAERPTLIAVAGSNNPVAEAGAGITVPPEDPKALASAMVEMAALSPKSRREMGVAGRRHLDAHYSMEHLAKRLAGTLDDCVRAQ